MTTLAQVNYAIRVTPLTIFIALCIGHQGTLAVMDGLHASVSDAFASFLGTAGFCSLIVAICTSLTDRSRGIRGKGLVAYRWWASCALITLVSHFQDPWTYRDIAFPANFGRLTIGLRSTHPYLDENEYRAFVKRPDGKLIHLDILPNTGGSSALKLSWYPAEGGIGPILRIQHRLHEDTLLDVSTGNTYDEDLTSVRPRHEQVQAMVSRSNGISLGVITEQWKYKPPSK